MSLSVDDLVSSLNTSHIGQDAIDLAALHAQLAQTLFASTSHPRQIQHRNTYTCNTPIARTRSNDDYSMDEDERMVEELLMPSSPVSAPLPAAHQPTSPPAHLSSFFPVSSEPSSTPSSVFTSTDPFYLATMQQQQQQQQSSSTSFFAQNGRLAQNSPFFGRQASTQHQHRENHHHPLTLDTSHSIFASAAY